MASALRIVVAFARLARTVFSGSQIEQEGFSAVLATLEVVDIKGLPTTCKCLAAQHHRSGK